MSSISLLTVCYVYSTLMIFYCCEQTKLDLDVDAEGIKPVIESIFRDSLRQQCHRLKKEYKKAVMVNGEVTITSPVPQIDDTQYNVLVSYWNNPKIVVQCVKSHTIYIALRISMYASA